MNPKKNLALLVAVLIAASAYYLYDVKWAAEKHAAEERKVKVLRGIDAKKLMRIALERKDEPYQMIRTEKGWRFVKPVDAAVDEDEMKRLLDAATGLKETRRIENAKDLSEFGLDKPDKKITFGRKGQDDLVLEIGDQTPTREFVYATFKNGGVFTIPLSDIEKFDKKVFDYRDRYVVDTLPEKVQKIEVAPAGKKPFTVIRDPKNKDQWQMTEPLKDRADRVNSEDVVSNLKWEKAVRFVEENPKDLASYGLDSPRTTIRIFRNRAEEKPDDGVIIGKEITKPDPGARGGKKERTLYYARRLSGGAVFLVKDKVVNDLPKTAFDLRYKTLIDYDVDDIQRFMIQSPGEKADIHRKGKKAWEIRVERPGGKKGTLVGRHQHVDDLLWDIKWANAVAYVDEPGKNLAPYGLTSDGPSPPWRFTLWIKQKKGPDKKHSFLLGPFLADKKVAYGRMDGQKRLFALSERDYKKLAKTAFFLSERRLVAYGQDDDINRIEALFADGRKAVLHRDGEDWVFDEPKGKKPNRGKVESFLSSLRQFEHEGVAPAGADFGKTRLRIELTDKNGKKLGPVTFGTGETEKWLYVRAAGADRTLRLSRKDVEGKLPTGLDEWIEKRENKN